MSIININNLSYDANLDQQAMSAITAGGLWGGIKKYAKKSWRYAKKTARSKFNTYKQGYYAARDMGKTLFYTTPKYYIYRPIKRRV